MTPFNAGALLVMLQTFYPVVGAVPLARARTERPEYFAGGRIFGSKGDKLELPDGRVFDLIYGAGGPAALQRWQVIEPGPGGDADPYELEQGPLLPMDDVGTVTSGPSGQFEGIVGRALDSLGDVDGAVGIAGATIAELPSSGDVDGQYDGTVRQAEHALEAQLAARGSSDIADELEQAGIIDQAVDSTISEYDQSPNAPELPPDPDPGPAPPPDPDEPGHPKPHPGGD